MNMDKIKERVAWASAATILAVGAGVLLVDRGPDSRESAEQVDTPPNPPADYELTTCAYLVGGMAMNSVCTGSVPSYEAPVEVPVVEAPKLDVAEPYQPPASEGGEGMEDYLWAGGFLTFGLGLAGAAVYGVNRSAKKGGLVQYTGIMPAPANQSARQSESQSPGAKSQDTAPFTSRSMQAAAERREIAWREQVARSYHEMHDSPLVVVEAAWIIDQESQRARDE